MLYLEMYFQKLKIKNRILLYRYRDKAAKDANEIFDKVGRQGLTITAEEVRLFCKESYNIRVIRGYPIYEELASVPNSVLTELGNIKILMFRYMMFIIVAVKMFITL